VKPRYVSRAICAVIIITTLGIVASEIIGKVNSEISVRYVETTLRLGMSMDDVRKRIPASVPILTFAGPPCSWVLNESYSGFMITGVPVICLEFDDAGKLYHAFQSVGIDEHVSSIRLRK
jgi:hypothetical protein